jgi:hypothetical protein
MVNTYILLIFIGILINRNNYIKLAMLIEIYYLLIRFIFIIFYRF